LDSDLTTTEKPSTTPDYSGCSETIVSTVGTLQSPGYPEDYPPNARCEWKLQSALGTTMSITFDYIDVRVTKELNYL